MRIARSAGNQIAQPKFIDCVGIEPFASRQHVHFDGISIASSAGVNNGLRLDGTTRQSNTPAIDFVSGVQSCRKLRHTGSRLMRHLLRRTDRSQIADRAAAASERSSWRGN